MRNTTPLLKVFIAIALAFLVGLLMSPDTRLLGIPFIQIFSLGGKLFLNSLTLVVVPLVCSSLITGTARMSRAHDFKSLGIKTFTCFALTVGVAILIGYFTTHLLQPGVSDSPLVSTNISLEIVQVENHFQKIEQFFSRLIPMNLFAAASEGQILGLITFCMLFGFFLTKIEAQQSSVVLMFWQGVFQIMMKVTQFFMKALPLGVFFLVAKVVALSGYEALKSGAFFLMTVVTALAIVVFIVFPIFLKVFTPIRPINHFRIVFPALLTAFSTSSSATTMPVLIGCLEKNNYIPARINGFVIPLGSSLNMPGTALYTCCAVFFIAQSYGISLSFPSQMIALLTIFLTSFGIAGIPSGSLFAVMSIASLMGLPAEGLSLILAVERILDMCRTTVNVFANSCCAALIAQNHLFEKKDLIPTPINI